MWVTFYHFRRYLGLISAYTYDCPRARVYGSVSFRVFVDLLCIPGIAAGAMVTVGRVAVYIALGAAQDVKLKDESNTISHVIDSLE